MGCAPMAYVLWSHVMNYNPANPKWVRAWRGHALPLCAACLALGNIVSAPAISPLGRAQCVALTSPCNVDAVPLLSAWHVVAPACSPPVVVTEVLLGAGCLVPVTLRTTGAGVACV
jgi:hypothetical protein